MCNRHSESGQRIGHDPCAGFIALQSDRDRLAGVVQGMKEQGQRNLDALRRAEAENARLRESIKKHCGGCGYGKSDTDFCRSCHLGPSFRESLHG